MRILVAGRTGQIQRYLQALERVGAEGVPMFQNAWEDAMYCDGLLLPGGGDIEPSLFGQANEGSTDIDEPLDRLQLKATEAFCKMGKPILGICKGMQILNVYFGGTVRQHLPTASAHMYRNGDQHHMTIATKDSVFSRIYGLRFCVNSAHHQGIGILGAGLEAVQFAEDQVIEGIVHTFLPIIGVQWHPERTGETQGACCNGDRLFDFWIQDFPTAPKI